MRVTKGCPICEGDVLGTKETDYYCRKCNILFSRRHIIYKHSKEETRRLIDEHFSGYERPEEESEVVEERIDLLAAHSPRMRFDHEVRERLEENVRTLAAAQPSIEAAAWATASTERSAPRRKSARKKAAGKRTTRKSRTKKGEAAKARKRAAPKRAKKPVKKRATKRPPAKKAKRKPSRRK